MFPAASSLTEIGTFQVEFPATVVIFCDRTGRAKNSQSDNQLMLLAKRMLPPRASEIRLTGKRRQAQPNS